LAYSCSPEDFVVTEINSKNEIVVLDIFEVPPQTENAESADTNFTAESAGACPDAVFSVPPLEELVSPEQYHSLQQLALTYQRTLVCDSEHQVELGE
jgi:hypothetical protein